MMEDKKCEKSSGKRAVRCIVSSSFLFLRRHHLFLHLQKIIVEWQRNYIWKSIRQYPVELSGYWLYACNQTSPALKHTFDQIVKMHIQENWQNYKDCRIFNKTFSSNSHWSHWSELFGLKIKNLVWFDHLSILRARVDLCTAIVLKSFTFLNTSGATAEQYRSYKDLVPKTIFQDNWQALCKGK